MKYADHNSPLRRRSPLTPCLGFLLGCSIPLGFALAAPFHDDENRRVDDLAPIQQPWEADAELVEKLSSGQNQKFNYRESNVPQFNLPNVLGDNPAATSAADWKVRREQTLEQFRSQVYGRRPTLDVNIQFEAAPTSDHPDFWNGLQGEFSNLHCVIHADAREFRFPFVIAHPNSTELPVSKPRPLVLFINNRSQSEFTDADRLMEFWAVDQILAQGYSAAMVYTADIDPDRADGYATGVRGFLADNQPRDQDAWGSLSAWGWGISRVLDYALLDPNIDSKCIALVGHSRGGKTALWAAAEDPRISLVYSNESGCGGAALSRRRFGETVGRITTAFPHWFCDNFSSYAEEEDRLPVDQHQLIALLAPRGVYVASAADDLWADPRGEFESLVAAAPVFQLLGKDSIHTKQMPPLNSPRVEGVTGYHIRSGPHDLTRRDWS